MVFLTAIENFWISTGIMNLDIKTLIIIGISFLLLYLAISKNFEPLLLIPIGFGGLLANIPNAAIAGPEGFIGIIYGFGIESGLFPLFIFIGVGAMTEDRKSVV